MLANAFPTFAFTIFFLIRKTKEYHAEFATYPARAQLETNFWTGNIATASQYWRPGKAHDTECTSSPGVFRIGKSPDRINPS